MRREPLSHPCVLLSRLLYTSFRSVFCLRCVWDEGLVRWSRDVEAMEAGRAFNHLPYLHARD